jgi:hypothetical protein
MIFQGKNNQKLLQKFKNKEKTSGNSALVGAFAQSTTNVSCILFRLNQATLPSLPIKMTQRQILSAIHNSTPRLHQAQEGPIGLAKSEIIPRIAAMAD